MLAVERICVPASATLVARPGISEKPAALSRFSQSDRDPIGAAAAAFAAFAHPVPISRKRSRIGTIGITPPRSRTATAHIERTRSSASALRVLRKADQHLHHLGPGFSREPSPATP